MPQVIIENPTPNSPFEGPARHFKFSGEDITNEIVEAGRVSSYLIPIAKPKKKDKAEIDEAAWSSLYILQSAVPSTRLRVAKLRSKSSTTMGMRC